MSSTYVGFHFLWLKRLSVTPISAVFRCQRSIIPTPAKLLNTHCRAMSLCTIRIMPSHKVSLIFPLKIAQLVPLEMKDHHSDILQASHSQQNWNGLPFPCQNVSFFFLRLGHLLRRNGSDGSPSASLAITSCKLVHFPIYCWKVLCTQLRGISGSALYRRWGGQQLIWKATCSKSGQLTYCPS